MSQNNKQAGFVSRSKFKENLDSNNNQENITNPHKEEIIQTTKGTKIHLVGGEKGGCGKSFFSNFFIYYYETLNLNKKLIIFDADESNADIYHLYENDKSQIVKQAFFSDDSKKIREVDVIFEEALSKKTILVNLPAQVFKNLNSWIKSSDLIKLAQENEISFVKWFISNGGVQSAKFFLESLKELNMLHVFVRNLGLCDDWSFIEKMEEFSEAHDNYKFLSIDLPAFPHYEKNQIEHLKISFSEALSESEIDSKTDSKSETDSKLSLISQRRINKMFFEPAKLSLESIKLVP